MIQDCKACGRRAHAPYVFCSLACELAWFRRLDDHTCGKHCQCGKGKSAHPDIPIMVKAQ